MTAASVEKVTFDNHVFIPFRAPLNLLPGIIEPQAAWLEFFKTHFGGSFFNG
jgi:hypothetical protein